MMRILFWTATFWPNIGGVEVLAAKLLPALRERGHEFLVVASKHHSSVPDQEVHQGIPVYRFSFQNHCTPSIIDYAAEMRRKVLQLKRFFAPDLVHINAVNPSNFFHLATNHAYRVPFLVTLHGQWENQIEHIVTHTLRNASWVTGCSAAVLERGRQLVPEITARSSVIYNGLMAPALAPEPISFNPPRLLCLGRLVADKGFDLALKALVIVRACFPSAHLTIAGDGPERASLTRQAIDSGLDNSVEFIGSVEPDAVARLINEATLVLLPSRLEAFGLVALEAALMARPVVATRVGGLAEVVAHEETGLLVDGGDSAALAEAIVTLLTHKNTARMYGRAARTRAQNVFSWARHVDAYDTLYRTLGERRNAG